MTDSGSCSFDTLTPPPPLLLHERAQGAPASALLAVTTISRRAKSEHLPSGHARRDDADVSFGVIVDWSAPECAHELGTKRTGKDGKSLIQIKSRCITF
jgi:hypothetical protein